MVPCLRSHRGCGLTEPLGIVIDHGEPGIPGAGFSVAKSWAFTVFPWLVSGTIVDCTGGVGSLVCLGFLEGRASSSIFPLPLPSTGGGSLGAWAVGSFMVKDLDLGAAGSGTKASSSVDGVFLFLSSFSDFLALDLRCLAISEKRGIVSAKSTDSSLTTDDTRDTTND